jgi:hypothetical protein
VKAASAIVYPKRLVSVVFCRSARCTSTTEGGGTIRGRDNGVKRLLARLVD